MNRRILCFLSLFFLVPALCRAEEDRQNSSPDVTSNTRLDLSQKKSPVLKITPQEKLDISNSKGTETPTGFARSALKTFFSLMVVLSLIFAVAWMLKKNKIAFGGSNAAEVLEVIGKRTVAQKQSIYLVRLGSRILVLGSGPEGLRSLSEITDPIEVDYLAGLCKISSQNGEKPLSFLSMFRKENRPNTPLVASPLVSSVERHHRSDETDDESIDRHIPQFREEVTLE